MRKIEVQCEYGITHVVDLDDETARTLLRQFKEAFKWREPPIGVLRLDDDPSSDFREQIRIPLRRIVSITIVPPMDEEVVNDNGTSTSDR